MKKMKKIAMLMALTLLSCNKIKETENKIEKNMIMNQINTVANTDITLLSGLNLDNSLFEKKRY